MKAASPEMIALLESGAPLILADLFTFTLAGGQVLRYTSSDISLPVGANIFDATGPLIERSRMRTIIGVEVDTLDLTVTAQASHLLLGVPWLQALRNGALDGAGVLLERAVMPAPGDTSAGTVHLFSGRAGDIEIDRDQAHIKVMSELYRLDVKMPRNLYQPGCLNTLFDTGCTLNKAAAGVASTVTGGSAAQILCGLAQASGWFDLGTLTFTSGALVGVSRTVKHYTPGVVDLVMPLPAVPAAGDAFSIYPGCDKRQATCASKFGNLPHFRGMPYVPAPDSVL